MRQTWRWFGPNDQVAIDDIVQAGAGGVVTALHHLPTGVEWPADEIARRQHEVSVLRDGADSSLLWEVVESLPVSENIKKRDGQWREHIAGYKRSLVNLAAAGVEVVCYNFMPVLDWTRTDLAYRLPNGATCMRFDYADFAVFDIHILERRSAAESFPESVVQEARRRFDAMSETRRGELVRNIVCGLPGAAERLTLDEVRRSLAEYDSITPEQLRSNFIGFLEEVVPVAEDLGLRICCHPDDPPFGLLGLPRIVSTEADYLEILAAVDSPANGVTFCTGSLGARADNDLPAMAARLADRIHFLHLRNVRRETVDTFGSFHEAEHLGGDTDMVAVMGAVLAEEKRRRGEGRADHSIPMRPDHGQNILDDLTRAAQPGYPAIGRLKGLAELRGILVALTHEGVGAPR